MSQNLKAENLPPTKLAVQGWTGFATQLHRSKHKELPKGCQTPCTALTRNIRCFLSTHNQQVVSGPSIQPQPAFSSSNPFYKSPWSNSGSSSVSASSQVLLKARHSLLAVNGKKPEQATMRAHNPPKKNRLSKYVLLQILKNPEQYVQYILIFISLYYI